MAETTLTIRLDEELKAAFTEVAEADERTAAQLLRHLMRRQVDAARNADEHDTWFREAVGVGLASLRDEETIPHDTVEERWAARRAELESRLTT